MTDITDQKRRQLREDAKAVISKTAMRSSAAVSIAQYVLATVDAPAPTLAERLEHRADLLDTANVLRTLATDARQMAHDLAEARAEAKTWREQGENDCEAYMEELASVRETLAMENHRADRIAKERDEALSEVKRLTAENENLRRTDNYKEFREQFLTVQKGAESNAERNAESIDPADVKPGEAWKAHIWLDGVRQPGTAIKIAGSRNWVVARDDGSRTAYRMNEYVELVSRLVPAPRVITNPDELDKLAEGAIVRDKDGDAWRRTCDEWTTTADYGRFTSWAVSCSGPVTVLWEPGA